MSDNPKLEWMYKTGKDLINREEYLTGRKVDKQFEELSAGQGEQNCVEHEVLPASISRKKDAFEDRDQVDILRKQMEDPLMAIKQKEMEARRKILENPVRLKEMYRLLKEEKEQQQTSTKTTSKKSKKKHRKSRSSSSSSSSSEDLDKLLMEKYKNLNKTGNDINSGDEDDDSNFIERKFLTLKKELDRMVKGKRSASPPEKSKKRSSRDSSPRHRNQRRSSERDERRDDRRRRDSRERPQRGNSRDSKREQRLRKGERPRDRSDDRVRNRSVDRKWEKSVDRKWEKSVDRKWEKSVDRKREKSVDRKRDRSIDRMRDRMIDRMKDRSVDRDKDRKDRRSRDIRDNRSPDRSSDRKRDSNKNRRSSRDRDRSPVRSERQPRPEVSRHRRDRSEDESSSRNKSRRSRSPLKKGHDRTGRKRPVKKVAQKTPERSSSSSSNDSPPPKRRFEDSDDEGRYNKPKSYGLVTASGAKIALENKAAVKRYTKEELRPVREAPKKSDVKRKKPLTEEEMNAIRDEMMQNASWREKDRETVVKRHRESEEREKTKHQQSFDKDFLNRHMKKAQDQVGSVESRIRSNLNNIQRSGRTMDSNFVKR